MEQAPKLFRQRIFNKMFEFFKNNFSEDFLKFFYIYANLFVLIV